MKHRAWLKYSVLFFAGRALYLLVGTAAISSVTTLGDTSRYTSSNFYATGGTATVIVEYVGFIARGIFHSRIASDMALLAIQSGIICRSFLRAHWNPKYMAVMLLLPLANVWSSIISKEFLLLLISVLFFFNLSYLASYRLIRTIVVGSLLTAAVVIIKPGYSILYAATLIFYVFQTVRLSKLLTSLTTLVALLALAGAGFAIGISHINSVLVWISEHFIGGGSSINFQPYQNYTSLLLDLPRLILISYAGFSSSYSLSGGYLRIMPALDFIVACFVIFRQYNRHIRGDTRLRRFYLLMLGLSALIQVAYGSFNIGSAVRYRTTLEFFFFLFAICGSQFKAARSKGSSNMRVMEFGNGKI